MLNSLAVGRKPGSDLDPMAPPAGCGRIQLTHFRSMPNQTAMCADQAPRYKRTGGGFSTEPSLLWVWRWSLRPACERPCGPSQRAFLGLAASDLQRLAVLGRPLGGAKRPELLLWGQSLAPKGPASRSGIAKQAQNACSAPVLLSRLLSSWRPGPMVELDCSARSGFRGGCSMTTASWASHACNELWVWPNQHVRSCCGACVYTAVSRSASRKQPPRAHAGGRSPWRPLGTSACCSPGFGVRACCSSQLHG